MAQQSISVVKRILTSYSVLFGGTVGSLFGLTWASQTLALDKYRAFFANYKDGKEQALDPYLSYLVQKGMDKLEIDEEAQQKVKLFTCYGNEPVHRGTIRSQYGAIVGLPPTFANRTHGDVNHDELRIGVRQALVNWNSDSGQRLTDSLVLSDQAKEFAIAREVAYTDTGHLTVEASLRAALGGMVVATGYMFQSVMTMFNVWPRVGVWCLFGGIYCLVYVSVSDAYACFRDRRVDRRLGRCSKDLAEGGLEYYKKMLDRNKATRELLGQKGAKVYTRFGNEIATLRKPGEQVTTRRDIMAAYLAKYTDKDSNIISDNAQGS